MLTHLKRFICALMLCVTGPTAAWATHDALIYPHIVVLDIQEGDICLMPFPYHAVFGIPSASYLSGTFSAAIISGDSMAMEEGPENINLLYTDPPLEAGYVFDSTSERDGILFEMELDVTAYAAKHEPAETVRLAKLALLAVAKDLETLDKKGVFDLKITLKGLPDQKGLEGTPLDTARTTPYTESDATLKALRKELLGEWCPKL